MKIVTLIVEDEPMARRLLEQYVAQVPYLELSAALPGALAALAWLREHPIDLLLLDVQMPELTGVGLLKALQHRPQVILTTAYSEYAIEGYSLDVVDYLLKPITFERFLAAVEKVHGRLLARAESGAVATVPASLDSGSPEFLFVKDGLKSIRLRLADVQYIVSLKDYVQFHTPERKITTLQSLKHLVEVLPKGEFLRIHNSVIIGIRWLEEIHRDEVQVAGTMLTVSDGYKQAFKEFVSGREL